VDASIDFSDSLAKAATTACNACHIVDNNDVAAAKTAWDASTGRTCASCHNAKATEGSMLERHPKHINSATYSSFKCAYCHSKTVAVGDDNVITNKANHANATKDLFFNGFQNNSANGSFDTGATRTCTNIYCHSNGTDLAGPYTDANDDPRVMPDWDIAGGMNCNGCHGSVTYGGYTAAMPKYVDGSPKNNSHVEHVVDNGIDCMQCHATTLSANGTIGNYALHINGSYDVSLPAKYVGSYAGGTCTNVTCHGGNSIAWGTPTVACEDCHSTTAADANDFTWTNITSSSMIMAKVNSTEWTSRGHGQGGAFPGSGTTGPGYLCSECHDTSSGHNVGSNPFRLDNGGDVQALCITCHGVGGSATKVDLLHHADSTTDARYAFNIKCVDCHDPHGDNNIFMVHSTIMAPEGGNSYTPSDVEGTPVNGGTGYLNVDFTGTSSADYADQTAGANKPNICNVCHMRTTDVGLTGSLRRYRRDMSASREDHNAGADCTSGCHQHNNGFEGQAGESPGNMQCGTCHAALLTPMGATADYHHYMTGDAPTPYPTDVTDPATRLCITCHVDHNIFSPANNPTYGVRARNLRAAADNTPAAATQATFVPTDFYPQNPKYDGNTNPFYQADGNNGVCISCHSQVTDQTKNTTGRYNDGSTKARSFTKFLYYSSSHNFQVVSTVNNFGDGSSFRANCAKCHGANDSNSIGAQTGSATFGLHDKTDQSLLKSTATVVTKPKIEELCYQCHDAGIQTTYDMYSSVPMSETSKLIKTAIVAKKSGHPINDVAAEGRHDPNEYNTAVDGSFNPAASRHVECTDCHNTHGGNAGIKRYPGGPYKGYTGSGSAWTTPAGNLVAGSQKGAWGVTLSYSTTPGASPSFAQTAEVVHQYELCLKCHSSYAYGDSGAGGVPSGLPDPAVVMTADVPYENFDSSISQADIAKMINKYNYGFHPIYEKGRNQPAKGLNGAWPPARNNWKYFNRFTNQTAFISVSGLSWNFVPPWNQNSLLACSDCHQADNTGLAIGALYPSAEPTPGAGSWTGLTLANVGAVDAATASTSSASATYTVDITLGGAAPASSPIELWAVAVGGSAGTKARDRQPFITVYDGIGGSERIQLSALGTGTALVRAEAKMSGATLTGWNNWATLESSFSFMFEADAVAVTTTLDYAGVEAIYPAAGDIRGPHGSLEKWILMDADPKICFDADLNGTLDCTATGGQGTDRPNSDVASVSVYDQRNLCYNCHRRDVYGQEGDADGASVYTTYSRKSHPLEGGNRTDNPTYNVWGIWCMNCHGGGGKGVIHGSFANSTTLPPADGWSNTRYNLTRPRGVRLLEGALFAFDPSGAGGTCYTPNVPTAYTGPGCAGQHANGVADGNAFNYSYNSW